MKECPTCRRCYPDETNHCPQDGEATAPSLLGEPTLDARYLLERREEKFKKVAVRLEEPGLQRLLDHPLAAGRSQRVILDVLGEAKHRRFRNTWDYLDWTDSVGNGTGAPLPGSNR